MAALKSSLHRSLARQITGRGAVLLFIVGLAVLLLSYIQVLRLTPQAASAPGACFPALPPPGTWAGRDPDPPEQSRAPPRRRGVREIECGGRPGSRDPGAQCDDPDDSHQCHRRDGPERDGAPRLGAPSAAGLVRAAPPAPGGASL